MLQSQICNLLVKLKHSGFAGQHTHKNKLTWVQAEIRISRVGPSSHKPLTQMKIGMNTYLAGINLC